MEKMRVRMIFVFLATIGIQFFAKIVLVNACRIGVSENICKLYGDEEATCRPVTCSNSLWRPKSPANAPYEVGSTHCQCMCSDGITTERSACLSKPGNQWTIGPFTCSNGEPYSFAKCSALGWSWRAGTFECSKNPQLYTSKFVCNLFLGQWVVYGICSDGLKRKTEAECAATKATWTVGPSYCVNKYGFRVYLFGRPLNFWNCFRRRYTWRFGEAKCSHPAIHIKDKTSCVSQKFTWSWDGGEPCQDECVCSNSKKYGGTFCNKKGICNIDFDCRRNNDVDATCNTLTGNCECSNYLYGGPWCARVSSSTFSFSWRKVSNMDRGYCVRDDNCNTRSDANAICSWSGNYCICSDPKYGDSFCDTANRCSHNVHCRMYGDMKATCSGVFFKTCHCSTRKQTIFGKQYTISNGFGGPRCTPTFDIDMTNIIRKTLMPTKELAGNQANGSCVLTVDGRILCVGNFNNGAKYMHSPDNLSSDVSTARDETGNFIKGLPVTGIPAEKYIVSLVGFKGVAPPIMAVMLGDSSNNISSRMDIYTLSSRNGAPEKDGIDMWPEEDDNSRPEEERIYPHVAATIVETISGDLIYSSTDIKDMVWLTSDRPVYLLKATSNKGFSLRKGKTWDLPSGVSSIGSPYSIHLDYVQSVLVPPHGQRICTIRSGPTSAEAGRIFCMVNPDANVAGGEGIFDFWSEVAGTGFAGTNVNAATNHSKCISKNRARCSTSPSHVSSISCSARGSMCSTTQDSKCVSINYAKCVSKITPTQCSLEEACMWIGGNKAIQVFGYLGGVAPTEIFGSALYESGELRLFSGSGHYDTPRIVLSASHHVIKISSGELGGCILTASGKVGCFGKDNIYSNGEECGIGESSFTKGPSYPGEVVDGLPRQDSQYHLPLCWILDEETGKELVDVVDIESGGDHTCAIMKDSSLYCFGYNTYGQAGTGFISSDIENKNANARKVIALDDNILANSVAYPGPEIIYMIGCDGTLDRDSHYPNLVGCSPYGGETLEIFGIGIVGPINTTTNVPSTSYSIVEVTVGASKCTPVTIHSALHISCKTPAHNGGTHKVVVVRGAWRKELGRKVTASGSLVYTSYTESKPFITSIEFDLSMDTTNTITSAMKTDVTNEQYFLNVSSVYPVPIVLPIEGNVYLKIVGVNFPLKSKLKVVVGHIDFGIQCAIFSATQTLIRCKMPSTLGQYQISVVNTSTNDSSLDVAKANIPRIRFLPPKFQQVIPGAVTTLGNTLIEFTGTGTAIGDSPPVALLSIPGTTTPRFPRNAYIKQSALCYDTCTKGAFAIKQTEASCKEQHEGCQFHKGNDTVGPSCRMNKDWNPDRPPPIAAYGKIQNILSNVAIVKGVSKITYKFKVQVLNGNFISSTNGGCIITCYYACGSGLNAKYDVAAVLQSYSLHISFAGFSGITTETKPCYLPTWNSKRGVLCLNPWGPQTPAKDCVTTVESPCEGVSVTLAVMSDTYSGSSGITQSAIVANEIKVQYVLPTVSTMVLPTGGNVPLTGDVDKNGNKGMITITGTNFVRGMISVVVRGSAPEGFETSNEANTAVSPKLSHSGSTSIAFTIPQIPDSMSEISPGKYKCDVVIFSTMDGVQIWTSADSNQYLYYNAPVITSVSNVIGAMVGGGSSSLPKDKSIPGNSFAVSITGSYFGITDQTQKYFSIKFGTAEVEDEHHLQWLSSTSLRVIYPTPGTDNTGVSQPGLYALAVGIANIYGPLSSTPQAKFMYASPICTGVRTSAGEILKQSAMKGRPDEVTIHGKYFGPVGHSNIEVELAGVPCTEAYTDTYLETNEVIISCIPGEVTHSQSNVAEFEGHARVKIGSSLWSGREVTNIFKYVRCNAGQFVAAYSDNEVIALDVTNVCKPCPKGTYQPLINQTECTPCTTPGAYCPEGSTLEELCPAGKFCATPTMDPESCLFIEGEKVKGFADGKTAVLCETGTITMKRCPAGHYCNKEATMKIMCKYVRGGTGLYNEKFKTAAYFCPEGSFVPIVCPEGYFCINNGESKHSCVNPSEDLIPDPQQRISSTLAYVCKAGSALPNICPSGSYCTDGRVYKCPIGKYCPEGSMVPINCEAGTICSKTGCSKCIECLSPSPIGSVLANAARTKCICAANYFNPLNSTSSALTYESSTSSTSIVVPCTICPRHTICASAGTDFENISIEPDYWWKREFVDIDSITIATAGFTATSIKPQKCKQEGVCLGGGTNNTPWNNCAIGHTGVLCSLCDDALDYVRSNATHCIQCTQGKGSSAVIITIALGLVLCFIISLCCVCQRAPKSKNRDRQIANLISKGAGGVAEVRVIQQQGRVADSNTGEQLYDGIQSMKEVSKNITKLRISVLTELSNKLKMVVAYVQVLSQLDVTINVEWPKEFREFYQSFDVFNLDIIKILDSFSPCDFSTTFEDQFIGHLLLLPLFVGLIFAAYILAQICLKCGINPRGMTKASVGERASQLINFIVFFMYPGLSMKCFRIFNCFDVNGVPYLSADPSIVCYEGRWVEISTFAISGIVVYVIGIPFTYGILLYRKRKLLVSPSQLEALGKTDLWKNEEYHSTKRKYGSLYTQYETRYWWFELVEMLRKAIMTGGLSVIPEGEVTRCCVGMFMCVLFSVGYNNTCPAVKNLDDILQQALLSLLFLTFFGGLMLRLSIPDRSIDDLIPTETSGNSTVVVIDKRHPAIDPEFASGVLIASNVGVGVLVFFTILAVIWRDKLEKLLDKISDRDNALIQKHSIYKKNTVVPISRLVEKSDIRTPDALNQNNPPQSLEKAKKKQNVLPPGGQNGDSPPSPFQETKKNVKKNAKKNVKKNVKKNAKKNSKKNVKKNVKKNLDKNVLTSDGVHGDSPPSPIQKAKRRAMLKVYSILYKDKKHIKKNVKKNVLISDDLNGDSPPSPIQKAKRRAMLKVSSILYKDKKHIKKNVKKNVLSEYTI